ncbi:hypothetical protein NP233_g7773 [Leucocoprinus birnbaumii]|uniref:F-box domain-containing protein n=1 Tax=Leucocoprinus birnbaumii TaxID=56174 RepID=A0AAD5VQ69_9AGAR|nr:hypothetical protein NP233_g7773 [Leucocoprinus birnbaumii]
MIEIFSALSPPPVTFRGVEIELKIAAQQLYIPVILGAVSTSWRKIAHSTHFLWTSFRWTRLTIKCPPALLLLCIRNSGVLPLHLDLHYPKYQEYPKNILIDPSVDNELIRSIPRIRVLKLDCPPLAWSLHWEKLLSLHELDICD